MEKINNKNKFKKGCEVVITISAVATMASLGIIFSNGIKQQNIKNDKRFEGITELLTKNTYGSPITLKTDGKPIITKLLNFNENEKERVIESIKNLDDISKTLSFKIYDNKHDDEKNTQINIYGNVDVLSNKSIGLTEFSYDNFNAKIIYPIKISISKKASNLYLVDDKTNLKTDVLSFVAKHEMMHALGFKDMYENEYLNKTIMYYNIDEKTKINGYTNFDIKNIQQLYNSKELIVELPKEMQLIYLDKKEKDKYDKLTNTFEDDNSMLF